MALGWNKLKVDKREFVIPDLKFHQSYYLGQILKVFPRRVYAI